MKKINLILPLILLVHLSLLVLLRFTAWPEMTLWPYLALKGWLPYKDIAMAHNPLLIFALADYYRFLGVSLLSLKFFTWALILLTDILIYFVVQRLTDSRKIAVLSVLFYVLWQPFFEGNGLWFDLALAPVTLLIFYFFWRKEFFWAGISLGLALLVKQTAVWLVIPVIWQLVLSMRGAHKFLRNEGQFVPHKNFVGDLSMLVLGLVIPLLAVGYWLLATGTLNDFYFWAVKFGIFYLPKAPGQVLLPTIKQVLALAVPFGFILPALFLKKERKLILILLAWFLFGSLGVYPRWSLFHFQPALPFLAIISGLVVWAGGDEFFHSTLLGGSSMFAALARRLSFNTEIAMRGGGVKNYHPPSLIRLLFFVIILFVGTLYFQFRFYKLNLRAEDRFYEPSTEVMASWIRKNSKPNEKIFVFNSWDNLYAMSNTLPATRPWVPILPWYLDYPGVQEKMVGDLQKNRPALIIFEPYKVSGLGSYKPKEIDKFIKGNYSLKEIVEDRFWILQRRP